MFKSITTKARDITIILACPRRGDQFYCIREKDSGYKMLTVYKMTWK